MRIPTATYRLQVHDGFTLHDANDIVDYLDALGITDLYLSPIFEASPGSAHGYDVVDPTRIRESIGGRAAFETLASHVREHGMGILLDIVPNHMAASERNPWWRDVLHRGRDSKYAEFFDIDWGTTEQPARMLLPILGGTLEEVIDRGELKLEQSPDGTCELEYFGRRLPVAVERCDPAALAAYQRTDERGRKEILRRVLDRQHYQLDHWTVASHRLGYRRFFDITDLAGVRVEQDAVFDATHHLVEELVREAGVTGLRIDHVDGLRDPAGYLERLRQRAGGYVVVEKILEGDEPLPGWPVQGTTGYDFLNQANGLFIAPEGHRFLAAAYQRLVGDGLSFADLVHEKKRLVMDRLFAGERTALAVRLRPLLGERATEADALRCINAITAALPVYRTYVRALEPLAPAEQAALDHAFTELQVRERDLPADLADRLRRVLQLETENREAALEFVLRWQQFTGPVMAKGVEDTALYVYSPLIAANEVGGSPAAPAVSVAEFHERMRRRAVEWPHAQSATDTHDTKRGEDTRARLAVLSEHAEEWLRLFRAWMRRSQDQKDEAAATVGLEEDAPVPNAKEESLLYQTLIGAWPLEGSVGDEFATRVNEYMRKALREGKENTSWRRPDQDYETALANFVDRLLAAPWRPALRAEIGAFAQRVAWYGLLNSAAQVLLKVTCPGVPDFYQGTELWALNLVDPDNRRPVDYAERATRLGRLSPLLASPRPEAVARLLHEWRTGDFKLFLTAAALRFRRSRAELFRTGDYQPLEVHGERAEHVVAFARVSEHQSAITLAPRLTMSLCAPGELPSAAAWGNTCVQLPRNLRSAVLRDVFTGENFAPAPALPVGTLLQHCPVALLGSR